MLWVDEPLDRLDEEDYPHDEQCDPVGRRRQYLCPLEPVRPGGRRGSASEVHRPDRTGQCAHIGEHVTGVRNQGQRSRQYTDCRLDSHIGDDQAERNQKIAAVGLGRNTMAVAVVSVSAVVAALAGKWGPGRLSVAVNPRRHMTSIRTPHETGCAQPHLPRIRDEPAWLGQTRRLQARTPTSAPSSLTGPNRATPKIAGQSLIARSCGDGRYPTCAEQSDGYSGTTPGPKVPPTPS